MEKKLLTIFGASGLVGIILMAHSEMSIIKIELPG